MKTKFLTLLLIAKTFFALCTDPTTYHKIVNNCSDTSCAKIDIWVNNILWIKDLEIGKSTKKFKVQGFGENNVIKIKKSNSSENSPNLTEGIFSNFPNLDLIHIVYNKKNESNNIISYTTFYNYWNEGRIINNITDLNHVLITKNGINSLKDTVITQNKSIISYSNNDSKPKINIIGEKFILNIIDSNSNYRNYYINLEKYKDSSVVLYLSGNFNISNKDNFKVIGITNYGTTLDFIETTTLGITNLEKEFIDDKYSFSPNPFENKIKFSNYKTLSITIYNELGIKLASKTMESNNSEIEIENLKNGTYILKIETEDIVTFERIVKQ